MYMTPHPPQKGPSPREGFLHLLGEGFTHPLFQGMNRSFGAQSQRDAEKDGYSIFSEKQALYRKGLWQTIKCS